MNHELILQREEGRGRMGAGLYASTHATHALASALLAPPATHPSRTPDALVMRSCRTRRSSSSLAASWACGCSLTRTSRCSRG
eukprot:6199466-Pleurochrysis_carterae.AAC.1